MHSHALILPPLFVCEHCSACYCNHLEINGLVKTTRTITEKQLNRAIRGTQKGTFNEDTCWLNLLDLIFWVNVVKMNIGISCSCQDNTGSLHRSINAFSFSMFKSLMISLKRNCVTFRRLAAFPTFSCPCAPGLDFTANMPDHAKKTALLHITEGESEACSCSRFIVIADGGTS